MANFAFLASFDCESPRGGFPAWLWYWARLGLLATLLGWDVSLPGTELTRFKTVSNTDYLAVGVGGLRNTDRGKIVIGGLAGVVKEAFLYWNGVVANTNDNETESIEINGVELSGRSVGLSQAPCWPGYGWSQTFRADVTSLVAGRGNGVYSITKLPRADKMNADGASVLVFYDDGDPNNNRDVTVYEGDDLNVSNPFDGDGFNLELSGLSYTGRGSAFLQLHVADGQVIPNVDDSDLFLENKVLVHGRRIFSGDTVPGENDGPDSNGNLWDIKMWEITNFLKPGVNHLSLRSGYLPTGDCLCLVAAVVNLPARPWLWVETASPGRLLVTWPQAAEGFVLQSSPDPSLPAVWEIVTEPAITGSNLFRVLLRSESGHRFFRLLRP